MSLFKQYRPSQCVLYRRAAWTLSSASTRVQLRFAPQTYTSALLPTNRHLIPVQSPFLVVVKHLLISMSLRRKSIYVDGKSFLSTPVFILQKVPPFVKIPFHVLLDDLQWYCSVGCISVSFLKTCRNMDGMNTE